MVDNIFTMVSYIKKMKPSLTDNEINLFFNIPEELDYI